jgi:quercetin dioxygenase-like cupin family protein
MMTNADEVEHVGPIRIRTADAEVLEGPGKHSAQIVSVHNAPEARITVTRVALRPGAVSPRHHHDEAEQTWIVEGGTARLLTENGSAGELVAGDVVITKAGQTHGIENIGNEDFVYLTVTTPPENMEKFYSDGSKPDTG